MQRIRKPTFRIPPVVVLIGLILSSGCASNSFWNRDRTGLPDLVAPPVVIDSNAQPRRAVAKGSSLRPGDLTDVREIQNRDRRLGSASIFANGESDRLGVPTNIEANPAGLDELQGMANEQGALGTPSNQAPSYRSNNFAPTNRVRSFRAQQYFQTTRFAIRQRANRLSRPESGPTN